MIVRVSQCEIVLARRSLKNLEPSARVSLQYDRLYVENEVFLYNDIEGKVERMLMGRGGQQESLVTPRPGVGGGGGRSSRLRTASRAGGDLEVSQGKAGAGTEAITELEAEIIQTGGHHVVLQEEDIIVRYDGPGEQEEGQGETEDEEMRLAESMSMAVFLNLNNSSQDSRQDLKRRRSNLKDINQLETVDEASRGEQFEV